MLQIQIISNLTDVEKEYSRSYVPELASQFRKEELILKVQLNGYGIQVNILMASKLFLQT